MPAATALRYFASKVLHVVTRVGPSLVGGRGLRISHDGMDGGAKAPIANRVEAPSAPTTNARREIAVVLAGDAGFACCCGAGLGGFVEGDGAVLG